MGNTRRFVFLVSLINAEYIKVKCCLIYMDVEKRKAKSFESRMMDSDQEMLPIKVQPSRICSFLLLR